MADYKFLDKSIKQKITMERNLHANYFYLPDKDLYEVHCSLNDYAHDVTLNYLCDMNKEIVVESRLFMDMTPETICQCVPALCKRIDGMKINKSFTSNVIIELLGKNGCDNITELFIFSARVLKDLKGIAVDKNGKKQKLPLTRNMHATYYYVPSKDAFEIKCTLTDPQQELAISYLCDMNNDVIVENEMHPDFVSDDLKDQLQQLSQKVVGTNLKNGYMQKIFMNMFGDDGNEDLALMYSFSGSAIAFVWVRHLCESGKLGWDQFGNTIFPIRINTCLAFNPQFKPEDIGAEDPFKK